MLFLQKYWRYLLGLALVLGLIAYVYTLEHQLKDAEIKLQQATILTVEQAQDKNVLQNKLDLSNQNAALLSKFVAQAQAGQVQPVAHFIVQAPTLQQGAEQVTERINAKDPTLPPQALEKTDNTIVTTHQLTPAEVDKIKKENEANKDTNKPKINEQFGVDVFKNNNYRNWEWSVGYGQHGSDHYVPVELQRNFSKDAAISAEYHIGGHDKGYEVKYTRKTDKLFFIF